MSDPHEVFIDELARIESTPLLYNQYAYGVAGNAIRRQNLLLYLQQMEKAAPRILLVGEAPGYRGSRITGVPFTSEHLLMKNREGLSFFGADKGYRLPQETDKLSKEATATIIWETLLKNELFALGWNALPFHPHQVGKDQSNRTPTKKELLIGEAFLKKMLELFSLEKVVAVGNKASESLTKMQVSHIKVRHPAQGGKNLFAAGIEQVKLELQKEVL